MPPAYLKAPPALPSVDIPYWCAGKEGFESGLLAAEVAARSREKVRSVYRCRSCGLFHIGSAPRGPKASKAVAAELIRRK